MNESNKRGRKTLPPAEVVDVQVNDQALARAGAAATEVVLYDEQVADNVRQVAKRFRYEGPLHPDLLEQGIRTEFRRGVESCLNVGAMLVLMREQCPQGEFMDRMARLGIERSLGLRFMQASIKLSATSQNMRDAIGNQSKMFELLVLDSEEIADLDQGGTVRGVTVDQISAMGVMEARRALREKDATLKAKDQVIKDKNAKIDDLSEQLHRRASSEPAAREAAQLELLRGDALAAEVALLRALVSVDTVMGEPATEAADLAARQTIDFLVQKLVDACLSRGITVDLAERVHPMWAKPLEDMAKDYWAGVQAGQPAQRDAAKG